MELCRKFTWLLDTSWRTWMSMMGGGDRQTFAFWA